VTQLLNDLFGIQSRAGCLCAGPYGHRLLHIDRARSEEFRKAIREGRGGLKPGWTRVNFHYLLTDEELDFLCEAIEIVAQHGRFFLALYEFDLAGGGWRPRAWRPPTVTFGIEHALAGGGGCPEAKGAGGAPAPAQVLAEARRLAGQLERDFDESELKSTERDLVPFIYMHAHDGGRG
jgi:hypothetical protein